MFENTNYINKFHKTLLITFINKFYDLAGEFHRFGSINLKIYYYARRGSCKE